DGIRDDLVTGVQTCALPIYALRLGAAAGRGEKAVEIREAVAREHALCAHVTVARAQPCEQLVLERIVGRPVGMPALRCDRTVSQIGRASCRERGAAWGGRES